MSCDDCIGSPIMQHGFYSNPCSEVLEDHARHVVIHQYVGCIKVANSWVIPVGEESVSLDVPALVDVLVGSCLWNPEFGTFKIIHYDAGRQKIKVQTTSDSAQAGTLVISCTRFIFVSDSDLIETDETIVLSQVKKTFVELTAGFGTYANTTLLDVNKKLKHLLITNDTDADLDFSLDGGTTTHFTVSAYSSYEKDFDNFVASAVDSFQMKIATGVAATVGAVKLEGSY